MVGRRVVPPEYVDWLSEFRKQGGFNFISQKRDFPMNTTFTNHPTRRSYNDITDSVLKSSRVTVRWCRVK
ncbi:unnamed protein product [Heligmosomoides polygyrus]|uniref:BRCT domain-containing protein n=1 Tax=Heligmosomoides polygyrus TaxID=6339 RepID=A0A183GE61_HELPZ|nr:unnamed protein product [Heligmosomoides polygyrus]